MKKTLLVPLGLFIVLVVFVGDGVILIRCRRVDTRPA